MATEELIKDVSANKIIPKHIAITITGISRYTSNSEKTLTQVLDDEFVKIKKLIQLQVKLDIPIMTFHLLGMQKKETASLSNLVDHITTFFKELGEDPILDEKKIKITVLGKWYDLPGRAIEPIKKVMTSTKDYDTFFVNLCILYDGREEILDAFRILGRKIRAQDIDPDLITIADIKDNIYTSYFLPPDIIIKTGKQHKLNGFLLWDSAKAYIYFANKYSPECSEEDFFKAILMWQKDRLELKKKKD